MALVVPPGIPSDGSWKVSFVSTIADPTMTKIATEINAAGSVAAECLLTKGGIGIDNSYEKFKDERLCTIAVFEQNGSLTWTINDLNFVMDPQTPTSPTNKLYALVKDGWTGFLVIRMGKASDVAWAVADKVWVVPVQVGIPTPFAPEANSTLRAKAAVVVIGTVQREVGLAA